MKYEIIDTLKLEVTRNCNLECMHCFRGDKQEKNMSLETIDKTFKNISSIAILEVTGGEPFMALEQLNRIYENIKNANVEVTVLCIESNCTLVNDEIINVLYKLSTVVGKLCIKTDFNAFKMMDLEEKGLKDTFMHNMSVLSKYLIFKDTPIDKIYKVGRAKNLTDVDINAANRYLEGKDNYVLSDESMYYEGWGIYRSPVAKHFTIFRTVYITVDGYLCDFTPNYHTYEEEDSMLVHNINDSYDLYSAIEEYRQIPKSKSLKK